MAWCGAVCYIYAINTPNQITTFLIEQNKLYTQKLPIVDKYSIDCIDVSRPIQQGDRCEKSERNKKESGSYGGFVDPLPALQSVTSERSTSEEADPSPGGGEKMILS